MLEGATVGPTALPTHLLLHLDDLLALLTHRLVQIILPAVLLNLRELLRVHGTVDGTPHDLMHHLAANGAVEIDLLAGELEVVGGDDMSAVTVLDVGEDGAADLLAADLASQVKGVIGLVDVDESFGGWRPIGEESLRDLDGLWVGSVVAVDPIDDVMSAVLVALCEVDATNLRLRACGEQGVSVRPRAVFLRVDLTISSLREFAKCLPVLRVAEILDGLASDSH